MNKSNQVLANEWFDSARSDYKYAAIGLEGEAVFPQVAFLSQQVAEKYLKGFLILKGVEPPRIHELPKLLDECIKIDSHIDSLRDACELLTGFYAESRYPPDIPDYTKDDISLALEKATEIQRVVESMTRTEK